MATAKWRMGNNKPQLIQRFHSGAKQSKARHFTVSRCAPMAAHTRSHYCLSLPHFIRITRMSRRHVVTWATTDTMAALIRHGLFKTGHQFTAKNFVRFYIKQKKPNPDKKRPPKIDSIAKSLAAKGFLRAQKAYTPPEDVLPRFEAICQTIIGNGVEVKDLNKKFALLNACEKEFNHEIPNSLLHTIETTSDILEFYRTPVDTNTPLDMMKQIDLPENVHIQFDYHRFHPETDQMFNGVTAFPKSSTLVTGLKYRNKYQGHEQRSTWPYNS